MRMPDFEAYLQGPVAPNYQMKRLRDMLDRASIPWEDNSDEIMCRTQQYDGDTMVFSAICGEHTYGTIELWTDSMRERREDPIGLDTAEEAFELIRAEVGA